MTFRFFPTNRARRLAILAIMAMPAFVYPGGTTRAQQASKTPPAGQGWVMAEVTVDRTLIHQSPNDAAYVTDEVNRGDMVWVREISPESDWLRVKPIAGSLSWILESDISEIRAGEGKVNAAQTRIRPGRLGARLPGPPGVDLKAGMSVWLLPLEPLIIPQRQGLMNWRAIEPPPIEPRFVRKECLRLVAEKTPPAADGFVAAKGPGNLAAFDELADGHDDDQPVSPAPAAKQPRPAAEPANEIPQPAEPSQTAGKPPAGKPAQPLEILDIPETLAGPAAAAGKTTDPLPGTQDADAEKFRDIGAGSATRQAGPVSPVELPHDPDAALETLESRFRVLMSEPLVSWDFRPILLACEALSARPLTAAQAGRLNRLKTLAERQEEIGRSSRDFWNSMRRSRSHDPGSQNQAQPVSARPAPRFDISGLLLPSRRDVDGHLLYNLIGETGLTIAYLKMPPAAPVEKWLGRKVGIRGRVRYHEELRGRLVTVQDVELLEPDAP